MLYKEATPEKFHPRGFHKIDGAEPGRMLFSAPPMAIGLGAAEATSASLGFLSGTVPDGYEQAQIGTEAPIAGLFQSDLFAPTWHSPAPGEGDGGGDDGAYWDWGGI